MRLGRKSINTQQTHTWGEIVTRIGKRARSTRRDKTSANIVQSWIVLMIYEWRVGLDQLDHVADAPLKQAR